MPAKDIAFQQLAREAVLRGVRTLAEAVAVTLGPKGRNVIIERPFGNPTVTKDGVTVAREIEVEPRFENMGAQMVKEVAQKTSDKAGDGTTTATVLARAIYEEGLKLVAAGHGPMELKRGIDKAVDAIVAHLKTQSKPTSGKHDIAQVGTISANGDDSIGNIIADAMEKVGKEGVITVEEAKGLATTLDVVEGLQFDKGYASPYFVTNADHMEAELDEPFILLTERRISALADVVPILEQVVRTGKPLVVVSDEIEGEALAALVVNKLRGTLKVCACRAPGFGDRRMEMLRDIAVLTGGEVVGQKDMGILLESAKLEQLGRARRVVVSKDATLIIDGAGAKADIEARVKQIRAQIEETTSDYDREKLQERLAKLVGGVAVIEVGAATETELKEKKARVEDALHATRAAVEEGIVPGGGVAYIRALGALQGVGEGEEKFGVDIVRKALEYPARRIAENAGHEGAVVVNRIREGEGSFGFNAQTEVFEDLVEAGVIDPTKVSRTALQNAASVASLLLTTEAMVAEKPRKKAAGSPGMGAGGMGDMDDMDY